METQPPKAAGDKPRDVPFEIGAAVVLSIAALLTSWASFQSALWEGKEAAHFSQASIVRVRASTNALAAQGRRSVDVGLFIAWLNAYAAGKTRLADFYRERFPPELRVSFDAWIKTDPFTNPRAPQSPFDNDGVRPASEQQARVLDVKAEQEYQAGVEANRIADSFQQSSVVLAITLFFGGIAQVFGIKAIRRVLLGVALLACAVGIARLVTLPALRLE
jgi:hypothetical protein